jgi:hypothetical protein
VVVGGILTGGRMCQPYTFSFDVFEVPAVAPSATSCELGRMRVWVWGQRKKGDIHQQQ